ncbi:MAG TPA: methionyl-tRNA formyltransferase [Solirubrobacterales bacterium]|nr:methionyl-tRNA formyltransferase [Solirubrobacterales bacterium]
MRTAYLGTSEFAATVLRRLAESDHEVVLVVTPPDSRRGRGRKPHPPPCAEAAAELGLELHRSANVNEDASLGALRAVGPEAYVVCAFGQLLREPLLGEWILNVHPSLLPRWRGAAPIERAIMAGDERTGTTIMRLTEGLDSGPLALVEETPIGPDEYFDEVSGRLAELSGELLVRALDLERDGGLAFVEQDESLATYAEKIGPADRRLDPSRPAAELARAVRALNPHVGTYLQLPGDERLGVRRAHAVEMSPAAGEIAADGGGLVLGTERGGLALEVVQPPGKRAMPADEFLRGHGAPTRAV